MITQSKKSHYFKFIIINSKNLQTYKYINKILLQISLYIHWLAHISNY